MLFRLLWSEMGDSNSRHPRLRRRFAVPEKIVGLSLSLDFFDRCTNNALLHLPLAAQSVVAQRLWSQDADSSLQIKTIETYLSDRSRSFGPRWETRTPGILLPKQARYQLR